MFRRAALALLPAVVLGLFAANASAALGPLPSGELPAGKLYVAFGDSYASGPGLPSRDANCGRSTVNYPSKVAEAFGLGAPSTDRWVDYTCAGALSGMTRGGTTTNGGLEDQVYNWAIGTGAYPQRTLGSETLAVTISIGGNDSWRAGSANVSPYSALEACRAGTSNASCAGNTGLIQPSDITSTKYAGWLNDILTTIHRWAPKAKILITSYPGIVPRAGQTPTCSGGLAWDFTYNERSYLHTVLSSLLTAQTAAAGSLETALETGRTATPTTPAIPGTPATVRVVDLYHHSNTHDMCNPVAAQRWVATPIWGGFNWDARSMHPTVEGMAAFATKVVTSYNTES